MASATPHTILLYRNGARDGHIQEEQAEEAITPGSLIEVNPTTGALRNHATLNGVNQRMIALENPYDDDTSSAAIDSPYASTDTVRFIYGASGDRVYMRYAAGGTALAQNDALTSYGDGTLHSITVGAATLDTAVVGFADEAVAGTATRVRVRIA
jgi:hypothetical protein